MIQRERHRQALEKRLRENPVVAVPGARQVGKTTLARAIGERRRDPVTHLDLDELILVHGGTQSYPTEENIRAVAAGRLPTDLL